MAAMNDDTESYTYRNMIARCYNEKHPSYKDYGGRGIRVCDMVAVVFKLTDRVF